MKQAWDTFLTQALPTRQDENWKYTDLGFLAKKRYVEAPRVAADTISALLTDYRKQHEAHVILVLVNGYFMPTLSDLDRLPEEIRVSEATTSTSMDLQAYPFAGLNAVNSQSGLLIEVAAHYQFATPLHILSVVTDEANFIAYPRNVIKLGENSHLILLEEYLAVIPQLVSERSLGHSERLYCHPERSLCHPERSEGSHLDSNKILRCAQDDIDYAQNDNDYFMNVVNHISLNQNARLEYYKIQQEGPNAIHMAHHFVQQRKNSQVTFMDFSLGAKFARDEIVVKLAEAGAECHTSGYYHLMQLDQYIDHHITIDHIAPHSHSEMLYKGVLDVKSRAVFNGRLHVAKNAQKILAYQANHNLLLAKEAEVYSKPELEIYADDVKCKHGASTGQIDADALFYLRSRGLSHDQAMNILLQGFATEIMQRIQTASIKDYVQGRLYEYARLI